MQAILSLFGFVITLDFGCIDECSKCCVEREYYPEIKFGKIGVLLLPQEKELVETMAKKLGIKITIFPRIGVSEETSSEPSTILAYQLMGKDVGGNTCPFLDTESNDRSPHGGYKCKIYDNRPMACKAYPLIESHPVTLDPKCKFCEVHKTASGNIASEIESLVQIKKEMHTGATHIWRYATGIGEEKYKNLIKTGWFLI